MAALRLAIADTKKTFGSRYSSGQEYLRELSELEAKQQVAAAGGAKSEQEIADALVAFRRKVMLSHPELQFGKLLFLKRSSTGYGHTYADQHSGKMGSSV